MFLAGNNKLKTTWLLWGTIITLVLVVAGVFGLDKIIYPIINNPECNPWFMDGGFWCSVAFIIGKVFSTKIWLVLMGLGVMVVFAKKTIKSDKKHKSSTNRFSIVSFMQDFVSKVKNSYAYLIFLSVLLAATTTGILKILIGRPRPMMLFSDFNPFVFDWAFNSMPSGHTAATFAGLVMLGMLAPKFKPLTWTLAIIVGLSRVYIGAHWPADVLLGAFIGMVAADLVKYWMFRRK